MLPIKSKVFEVKKLASIILFVCPIAWASPVLKIIGSGYIMVFTHGNPNVFPAMTVEVDSMEQGKNYTMLWADTVYASNSMPLFSFIGTSQPLITNCIVVPGYNCGYYRTIE